MLIPLTQGLSAIVDECDYEELSKYKWRAVKSGKCFYAARGPGGSPTYMHNHIVKPSEGKQVDHINWDGLDNRRQNLRSTTKSGNLQNKRKQSGKSSKFLGVHRVGESWVAQTKYLQKKIRIGTFKIEEDAARAYDAKVIELHGEQALTNKRLGLLIDEPITIG